MSKKEEINVEEVMRKFIKGIADSHESKEKDEKIAVRVKFDLVSSKEKFIRGPDDEKLKDFVTPSFAFLVMKPSKEQMKKIIGVYKDLLDPQARTIKAKSGPMQISAMTTCSPGEIDEKHITWRLACYVGAYFIEQKKMISAVLLGTTKIDIKFAKKDPSPLGNAFGAYVLKHWVKTSKLIKLVEGIGRAG